MVNQRLDANLLRTIRESRDTGYPLADESFKRALAIALGRKTEPVQAGRPQKRREPTPSESGEIGL